MLRVSGLTKVFGGFTAVDRISFDLAEGEILGLIGPNGSGKSTTFNLIAGALAPTAGSIEFLGREIAGTPANKAAHLGIGRTYQIPRPFRKLSLTENVGLAAFYGQAVQPSREQAWALAKEALALVNLPTEDTARIDIFKACENLRGMFPYNLNHNVEPSAMTHPHNRFNYAAVHRVLQYLIQQRDERINTLQ